MAHAKWYTLDREAKVAALLEGGQMDLNTGHIQQRGNPLSGIHRRVLRTRRLIGLVVSSKFAGRGGTSPEAWLISPCNVASCRGLQCETAHESLPQRGVAQMKGSECDGQNR